MVQTTTTHFLHHVGW